MRNKFWRGIKKQLDNISLPKLEDEIEVNSNDFIREYIDGVPPTGLFKNYSNPLRDIDFEVMSGFELERSIVKKIVTRNSLDNLQKPSAELQEYLIQQPKYCDLILKYGQLWKIKRERVRQAFLLMYLEELKMMSQSQRSSRFVFSFSQLQNLIRATAVDCLYYGEIPEWIEPLEEPTEIRGANFDKKKVLGVFRTYKGAYPHTNIFDPIEAKNLLSVGTPNRNHIRKRNEKDEPYFGDCYKGFQHLELKNFKNIRGNLVGSAAYRMFSSGCSISNCNDIDIRVDYLDNNEKVSDEDFEAWIDHNFPETISREKVFGNDKCYKVHLTTKMTEIPFEIFRGSFGGVCSYHLPTVRLSWDPEEGFLMYPSFISTYLTGKCCDLRGFYSSKKNPYLILWRTIRKGYQVYLPPENHKKMIEYIEAVNAKIKRRRDEIIGNLTINDSEENN
jgi:hypothetical protein